MNGIEGMGEMLWWPYVANGGRTVRGEATDGQVVRAGVSVTWNVLSWSGGHEFEPRSGRTWGAWYFCPKSYLNQNIEYRPIVVLLSPSPPLVLLSAVGKMTESYYVRQGASIRCFSHLASVLSFTWSVLQIIQRAILQSTVHNVWNDICWERAMT